MSTPAGPYEMNPITGEDTSTYVDFRPQQGTDQPKTAFQEHLERTAFQEEQKKKDGIKEDADALFGEDTGEPRTAFELECRGGRAPLDAPESATPSQAPEPAPTPAPVAAPVPVPESPEAPATVAKESVRPQAPKAAT